MLISIIIPTLNEQAGIDSFLAELQPLRCHCELILVDGGSVDNTVALAENQVDHIILSEQGRAMQMNAGAKIATAPIVLFLHADTYLPTDVIKQIQQAMSTNHQWGRFNIRLAGRHIMLPIISWFMNKRSCWTGIATGDQGIFIDKNLLDKVGGFPAISLMEDIALSKKLKQISKPYCSHSKVISSGRRWLKFGVFKTIALMWWLRLSFFLGTCPNTLAQQYREGRFWKV